MIAFTPFAGLVAWVENTVPLAEYLTGKDRNGGAHCRYARPGDLSHVDCFSHLARTGSSKKPLRVRYPPPLHPSPSLSSHTTRV